MDYNVDANIRYKDAIVDLTADGDDANQQRNVTKPRKRKHDAEDEEAERKRIMANNQERVRMQKINRALDDLRKVLPQEYSLYHRRMSKIRTLRVAMNYIKSLSDTIIQDNIRRHELFNPVVHTIQTPPCPDMTTMSSTPRESSKFQGPCNMSPVPCAAMFPVYPYLGPLCMGFEPSQSPYHTPEQTLTRKLGNPRHLKFEPPCTSEIPLPHPSCTDGIMETPIKRYRRENCSEYNKFSSRHFNPSKLPMKTETITSPLLGQRNPTEFDSSLLSSSSDTGAPDDIIAIAPLQTDGQMIPTGRTLADILNDNEDA